MLELETPLDIKQHVGRELGPSEWMTVDQPMIDQFAKATGDHQWIHVDVERAAKEMPGGKTIAHGFLTLSLIPGLTRLTSVMKTPPRHTLNYGLNKVRFVSPVPVGSRVRARVAVIDVTEQKNGW